MPMKAKYAVLLAALLVSGCSETSFLDVMGMGKSAPNDRLVTANQPLSVPPDMQLRPPSGTVAPSANSAAAGTAPRTLANPPQTASAAPAPTPAPGAPATVTAQPPANDVYARYGISRYKPDGTKKSMGELNNELAEKIKEEKRRKNPRYGTIFNMGNIFSGD